MSETARTRCWWSTWWPFGLAWPATGVLFVLATWCANSLDSRLPVVFVFPFAAAAATTRLSQSIVVAAAALGQVPVYALAARAGSRRQHSRAATCAILVFHLVGIGLGSPLFWGPSLSGYGRRLAEVAGAEARNCGIAALGQDRQRAAQCARTALAEGRPFSVAFQVMGVDSTIYEGLAYRAPGQATRIGWDSDVTGGYNLVPLRRVHQETCTAPAIRDSQSTSPIGCGERGDPGSSE